MPDPKDKAPLLQSYKQAIEAAGTGRLVDAADRFKAIVAAEPLMTDAWSQYGTVLMRLGRYEDALAAFKQVIRQQPDEPPGPINAATMLLQLGRYDEAKAHAELALRLVPGAAHELLAKIALARKDADGALREAAAAEQADPTLPTTAYVRGLMAHEQALAAEKSGDAAGSRAKFSEALQQFMSAYERASSRTMQIPDLRYYIGDSLARLDRHDEAEKFFKEEIAMFPHNARTRAGLAMLYAAANRLPDVERTIAQMLEAAPTPEGYRQAAELWRLFGFPDRAEAVRAASRAKFGKTP